MQKFHARNMCIDVVGAHASLGKSSCTRTRHLSSTRLFLMRVVGKHWDGCFLSALPILIVSMAHCVHVYIYISKPDLPLALHFPESLDCCVDDASASLTQFMLAWINDVRLKSLPDDGYERNIYRLENA